MTLALVPLSMSTIGLLPEPCRSCVFWELDAEAATLAAQEGITGFEKEVWLSGVMLTWGSAGLIVTQEDKPVGYALFAPPSTVAAVAAFPTGPVSPDAVLITSMRVEPTLTGQGIGQFLIAGVIRTLTARGVRAIEVFGREKDAKGTPPARHFCTVPADFARKSGFTEVVKHHKYPRLRYELSGEHNWKAEVEAALEHLIEPVLVGASA